MFSYLKPALVAGFIAIGSALMPSDGNAVSTGVAVAGIGSTTEVGNTEYRPLLGGEAIMFYIPLSRKWGRRCVYGVRGCGLSSDYGGGSAIPRLSMFLMFTPVSTTAESVLDLLFEDLDLAGVNDPTGFLEFIEVFDADGNSLTGQITSATSAYVSGTSADTQSLLLSLALGVVSGDPLYLRLAFGADFLSAQMRGRNTPEYLIATVREIPLQAIPAPPALLLLLSALGSFGFVGWRKKKLAET